MAAEVNDFVLLPTWNRLLGVTEAVGLKFGRLAVAVTSDAPAPRLTLTDSAEMCSALLRSTRYATRSLCNAVASDGVGDRCGQGWGVGEGDGAAAAANRNANDAMATAPNAPGFACITFSR